MLQAEPVTITDNAMAPRLRPGPFANAVNCDLRAKPVDGSIVVVYKGEVDRIRILRLGAAGGPTFEPLDPSADQTLASDGWKVAAVVTGYWQFLTEARDDAYLYEFCPRGLPLVRPVEA